MINPTVLVQTYPEPPFSRGEILAYAGCRGHNTAVDALLDTVIAEVRPQLCYRTCRMELPLELCGNSCRFGALSIESADLSAHLNGCDRAVVFAATVGVGIDRLILKYGHLSPTKALLAQAVGAERIEALCDALCASYPRATTRFSPGYGDLPLETQRDLFRLLSCEKHIGLVLNDSLMMSPSKSVTAIFGLRGGISAQ